MTRAPLAEAPRAEIERIELDLLLEAVYQRSGFDFRSYARASLRRRVWRRMLAEGLATLSALQERVLHEPDCMKRLLLDLSINVTTMFRDQAFYAGFISKVVPMLHTYPFVRVWNAGCSTGEETFSLAIVLREHDLYERTRIYATDMNEAVLERARAGEFPLERVSEYDENYRAAGGLGALSDHYTTHGDVARFDPSLTDNVVFAQHNLVSDGSFNEFHVIFCRNVMIYFDQPLQAHVHKLLYGSLARLGVLGVGLKESVRFTPFEHAYDELVPGSRLYQRIA